MSKAEADGSQAAEKKRVCFIIMPISDHANYQPGHFGRVYEYIIKPACELAGFTPIRADDVKTTNLIALDIIKQIIESDMAICDLSSQNPNVLYEVGIRQAFNLPVTFMKDSITKRIFDIQGFRDVSYDENLRIDRVEKAVNDLSEVILNTYENKDEVNSLVTLLGIKAAKISNTEISADTDIILNAIKGLEDRISKVEKPLPEWEKQGVLTTQFPDPGPVPDKFRRIMQADHHILKPGQTVFHDKFGIGKIVATRIGSTGVVVIVNFETLGRKELLLKFAKLYIAESAEASA